MNKRIYSELNFHRARKKGGNEELNLLKKSLQQHPANANSSTRWLNRADAESLKNNRMASEAALSNTLFLSLRKLRDAKTHLGENAFQFEDFINANAMRSISQIFQDLWVLYEHNEKKSGYFVEFGATNGADISNTLLLERDYGWNGILAEPNPVWHDKLRSNRKAAIETKCVSSASGDKLELILTEDPEFASTTRDTVAGGEPPSKRLSVETISLADMLNKHKAPDEIDFLSIDTEGSELSILSAYDFSKERKIRLIAVEHNFEKAKRDGLRTLLTTNGYERTYTAYSMFDDWYRLTD